VSAPRPEPFEIAIPDADLGDLRERLQRARFADDFANEDWRYGVEAPTGIAVFPKELLFLPRKLAEQNANLTHWTRMPSGGHFAPAEEPERLVEDIRACFRPLRS